MKFKLEFKFKFCGEKQLQRIAKGATEKNSNVNPNLDLNSNFWLVVAECSCKS